jgi:ribosomal small subunit protein bTHX
MGKGDIKTKKGKRHIGSYGKLRPQKKRKTGEKKQEGNPQGKGEA